MKVFVPPAKGNFQLSLVIDEFGQCLFAIEKQINDVDMMVRLNRAETTVFEFGTYLNKNFPIKNYDELKEFFTCIRDQVDHLIHDIEISKKDIDRSAEMFPFSPKNKITEDEKNILDSIA